MFEVAEHEQVANPFKRGPVTTTPSGEVAIAMQSAREVAEVQAAMIMARRFPRIEVEVVDRILQACTRPSLAEGALYEFARGGTDVRGPSIRLAECVAQYWGHLDYGWRVLEERPGATKIQAFAWDMQTGTRSQVVFDVVHERIARGERKSISDPRDVYEHIANAASRRLRACILRVVPGDVIEAAVQQCEVTLKTKAEVTPERLKNLVDQFAVLGVTKQMIEKRIQRRLEAMTPGMMVQLGRVYTSLRDAVSQPGDWFDLGDAREAAPEAAGAAPAAPAVAGATGAVKQRLQGRGKPKDVAPDPAPAAPKRSDAYRDVVSFAKAAQSVQDIARAEQVAMSLTDEEEVRLAQEHLDAARERITE